MVSIRKKSRFWTVDKIFKNFLGRRNGLRTAFTTERNELLKQCDPEEFPLCLFGFPNEKWRLEQPTDTLPPSLPEPVSSINFFRDDMSEEEWLLVVAAHSDAWLMSLAFSLAAKESYNETEREQLFRMLNKLTTLSEIVREEAKKDKLNSKSKSKRKPEDNVEQPQAKFAKVEEGSLENKVGNGEVVNEDDKGLKDEERNGREACGKCGEKDGFWVSCDGCNKWFHGECVGFGPDMAEDMDEFKCPSCST